MAQNLEAIYPTIAWRRGSWHGCESRICEPGAGPLLLARSPGSGRAQRPGNALNARLPVCPRAPDPGPATAAAPRKQIPRAGHHSVMSCSRHRCLSVEHSAERLFLLSLYVVLHRLSPSNVDKCARLAMLVRFLYSRTTVGITGQRLAGVGGIVLGQSPLGTLLARQDLCPAWDRGNPAFPQTTLQSL